MNHVLLWKEYRQQRAIWLAVALLGIFLVLILGLALGQGSGLEAFRDGSIRPTLIVIILALGVTYGIVSGALLLAGEKEDHTLDFLDGLAGERGPVWHRKATAGALFTLAQAIVMSVLLAGLGLGSWRTALVVFYWCLDGLAWGLLGGSLCNKVLTAVLVGVAFMGATWLLVLFVNTNVALYLGKAMLAGAGVLYSRKMFCQDDPTRQIAPRKSRFTKLIPASWRVLVWLSFRQGRWVLAGGLVFAIALGLTVNLAPLILWPIGTLLLGLACGLAAFCPDQGDGGRFLGAQRFSPGEIWFVKTCFWGTAAFLFTVLAWQVGLVSLYNLDPNVEYKQWFRKWIGSWTLADEVLSPNQFLVLWALYGFPIGQFFGHAASRPIIGSILAMITAPVMVGLWVPSLFFGGVPAWQFLAIPVMLLIGSGLAMWPWMSGRLLTGKPLVGIAAVIALVAVSMAGFLWYRAIEVPDVGEPFDVKAYIAHLPSPEQNQAGILIRTAAATVREHKKKVEDRIEPPTKPIFAEQNALAGEKFGVRAYEDAALYIPEKGWPKNDKEIGRWLDLIFQGDWFNQVTKATRLPLGLIQDPRLTGLESRAHRLEDACTLMSLLLTCRALQMQAHGDSPEALRLFETALALTRQMKNNSSEDLFLTACRLEWSILGGFDHWLRKAGPDKKLLREALSLLQRHETATPDPTGSIKAQFLVIRNSQPTVREKKLIEEIHRAAYQVPWENERQNRIVSAATLGQLRQAQKPVWQIPDWREFDHFSGMARSRGLPPADGPGSGLSAKQWGEFLHQSWAERYSLAYIIPGMRKRPFLRAAQLVTALALYQADKGEPPARLDDLVPDYLAALPIDPSNGKPFRYRISKGEEIKRSTDDNVKLRLMPGQALVWSEGPREYKFPVPVWEKGTGP
jgi:hypothetical protein